MTLPALPAPRTGGAVRRGVLAAAAGTAVVAAAFVTAPAFDSVDPYGRPVTPVSRAGFLAVGGLLLALPYLLVVLPGRRAARRAADAVLARPRATSLPPAGSWGGPGPIFRRLVVGASTYAVCGLALLGGAALLCLLVLGEPVAAALAAGLALLPAAGLAASLSVPGRVGRAGRRAAADGRAVPVRVVDRFDQALVGSGSSRSWYVLELVDGARAVVTTPVRYSWRVEPVEGLEADTCLVVSEGGRHGVLVPRSRPHTAVWLLGPVPSTRLPRSVQRAIADRALEVSPPAAARG